MQYVNGRGRKTAYDVSGNVIWLSHPGRDAALTRPDPVASLKRSVTRLVDQVERSGRLKTDIEAAIDTRRYELYRRSSASGARASDRGLAAAQRLHVGSLLRFVHAIAAVGSDPGPRAGRREPADRTDSLARSIRELEASLKRARQLSRDVLAECQRRGWPGDV